MKTDRDAAEADPLIAIAGGGGVGLFNSMGDAWTADSPFCDRVFTVPMTALKRVAHAQEGLCGQFSEHK